jgi:hypothetical protein
MTTGPAQVKARAASHIQAMTGTPHGADYGRWPLGFVRPIAAPTPSLSPGPGLVRLPRAAWVRTSDMLGSVAHSCAPRGPRAAWVHLDLRMAPPVGARILGLSSGRAIVRTAHLGFLRVRAQLGSFLLKGPAPLVGFVRPQASAGPADCTALGLVRARARIGRGCCARRVRSDAASAGFVRMGRGKAFQRRGSNRTRRAHDAAPRWSWRTALLGCSLEGGTQPPSRTYCNRS